MTAGRNTVIPVYAANIFINCSIINVVIDMSAHPFALHKYSNQFQRFIIDRNIKLPQFFHNPKKFFLLTT